MWLIKDFKDLYIKQVCVRVHMCENGKRGLLWVVISTWISLMA